jgi:hypothetical protein
MIERKPKPNERELERLKWEYIKQSPKYGRFCEWFHKKYIKEPIHGGHRLVALTNFGDIDHFDKRLPKEFHPMEDGHGKGVNPIIHLYCMYGDVYNLDFDEFWKKRMNSRTATRETQKRWRIRGGSHPVHDYVDFIEHDIRDAIDLYKDDNKIDPKLSSGDLEPYLKHIWNGRNIKILRIECEGTDMKEIKEAVGHVLHNCLQKRKPEPKALGRYLVSLVKKERKENKVKIFEETRPGVKHYEDPSGAVDRDVQCARRIIENLENGRVPWWKTE